jgi:glycine/D-amino acid oxidase-like deaminating enzyme/nitrite reductase/ring-hydroxylating ferredoxin subunit
VGSLRERNRSVWVATTPETSYASLAGSVAVDVAVVGGGITGLTTAFLLKEAGATVAVIEAGRVASGTTGYTTAKITALHGLTYAQLMSEHGPEKAHFYADANQAAVEKVAALIDQLGIDCQFERQAAYTYTETDERQKDIAAEVEAAVSVGLPVTYVEETGLPFPIRAAVRLDNQAQIHPRRYCLALAEAIAGDGGQVLEQTRALDIDEESDRVTVHTDRGDVVADQVVVATLLPFGMIGGFFAKAQPSRSYAIAVRLQGEAPSGMYLRVESPTRSIRPLRLLEGEVGLVLGGDSHKSGQETHTEPYYNELETWAKHTFDVRSIDYRWSAQDYTTVDSLPYVGRSPGRQRTLVATGFKKWGMSNGTAAAMLLSDLITGQDNPWLTVYDATRIGGIGTTAKLVKENISVAKRFVQDRIAHRRAPSLEDLGAEVLKAGEGRVVDVEGDKMGAYRHHDGTVHAVSITCTHMGCALNWNNAEATWDCPCHGSRFDYKGQVINGPAVKDLDHLTLNTPAQADPSSQ